jgi:hypothetical protein
MEPGARMLPPDWNEPLSNEDLDDLEALFLAKKLDYYSSRLFATVRKLEAERDAVVVSAGR